MKKKTLISTILIIFGAISIIFFMAIPVLGDTVIETPRRDLSCWVKPAYSDAVLEYVATDDALRLTGSTGENWFDLWYGYVLSSSGGASLVNRSQIDRISFIGFDLRIDAEKGNGGVVKVLLETTAGVVTLSYQYVDRKDGMIRRRLIYEGLGTKIADGEWHTIFRNIKADFKEYYPYDEILEVKSVSLYVFGDENYVRNIRFYSTLPEWASITMPDYYTSISKHNFIDDGNNQPILTSIDFFNEIGELVKYCSINWFYDNELVLKGREDVNRAPRGELISTSSTTYPEANLGITIRNNSDGMIMMRGIIYWRPRQVIEQVYTYYHNGNPWLIMETNTNYRAQRDSYGTYIYKTSSGEVIRRFEKEYVYEDGGIKIVYSKEYDCNGNLISRETQYNNPRESLHWWFGKWYEREQYDDSGGLTKITRGRFFWIYSGIRVRLECVYDGNNKPTDFRMHYRFINDKSELEEEHTLCYDGMGELRQIKEEKFAPMGLNSSYALDVPELTRQALIESTTRVPDTLVMDGDMQSKRIDPFWKPKRNEIGKAPVCRKTRVTVNGRSPKALRIEKLHEEEETPPVFVQQFIPISGGEHKLVLKYQRWTGKAVIRVGWVSIEDLWSTEDLNPHSLVEYTDDHNGGIQDVEIPFTTPNEPGVLILKLGAASTVDYMYADIRQYTPPSISMTGGQSAASTYSSGDTPGLFSAERNDRASINVSSNTGSIGNNTAEKYGQENQEGIPVFGNYRIVVLREIGEENEGAYLDIISDNDVDQKETVAHIRTTRGAEIWVKPLTDETEDEKVVSTSDISKQADRSDSDNLINEPAGEAINNYNNDHKSSNISTLTSASTMSLLKPKGFIYYIKIIFNLIKDIIKELL